MQVDFPSYTVEDSKTGATGISGTYVTPVVYYGRLMVFFLQFAKKTLPASPLVNQTFTDYGTDTYSRQGQHPQVTIGI